MSAVAVPGAPGSQITSRGQESEEGAEGGKAEAHQEASTVNRSLEMTLA